MILSYELFILFFVETSVQTLIRNSILLTGLEFNCTVSFFVPGSGYSWTSMLFEIIKKFALVWKSKHYLTSYYTTLVNLQTYGLLLEIRQSWSSLDLTGSFSFCQWEITVNKLRIFEGVSCWSQLRQVYSSGPSWLWYVERRINDNICPINFCTFTTSNLDKSVTSY